MTRQVASIAPVLVLLTSCTVFAGELTDRGSGGGYFHDDASVPTTATTWGDLRSSYR